MLNTINGVRIDLSEQYYTCCVHGVCTYLFADVLEEFAQIKPVLKECYYDNTM